MKKPTWMVWIAGVMLWALFYWLIGALIHRSVDRDNFAAALESGLVGGTLTWWLALWQWQKKQRELTLLPRTSQASASSNV